MALVGGFIFAELAARRPDLGGQYAYIREAYHLAVAFVYGWALLLVTQTGARVDRASGPAEPFSPEETGTNPGRCRTELSPRQP